MSKWLKTILAVLPTATIIDLLCDWLAEQAAKTDNDLDDSAVQIIRVILNAAFGKTATA